MNVSNLTRGQVERNLTQRLQAFYLEELGRRPEKIICQFFDEKLAIVVEKILTPSEKLLLENERYDFAEELRKQLDIYIKPRLQSLLEEIIGTGVILLLIDTNLDAQITGIIAILKSSPSVRDPDSIPKVKKEKVADSNNE